MIYCVDDDATIREIEVYTLEQTGFTARGFADGKALYAALETEIPELIILDIMLPGDDGMAILEKLRNDVRYQTIPVIMATAKGTEVDKINGLNQGADDYLVKPFGMMEMVARIQAVLRRSNPSEQNLLTVGQICLNDAVHQVSVNGSHIELTPKEYTLLALFLKHKNIAFSREKLMWEVWGSDYVGESRTVDMHIKTLRQKLGPAGGQIKTVIGVGYRMEQDI